MGDETERGDRMGGGAERAFGRNGLSESQRQVDGCTGAARRYFTAEYGAREASGRTSAIVPGGADARAAFCTRVALEHFTVHFDRRRRDLCADTAANAANSRGSSGHRRGAPIADGAGACACCSGRESYCRCRATSCYSLGLSGLIERALATCHRKR